MTVACRAGANAAYASDQHPLNVTVSLISRMHGSRNQGVEVEMILLITHSAPLAKFLLLMVKSVIMLTVGGN